MPATFAERALRLGWMLAVAAAVGAAHQAFASVSVKDVIVTCWPLAIDVLSKVMSPPPPVAVMVPWMPQTVPPLSEMRKWPAVPAALALRSCHVPEIA